MASTIKFGNVSFNKNFFNSYIKNIFGESFAHSSLSFEKLFENSKLFSKALEEFSSPTNSAYALSLIETNTQESLSLLKQRYSEVCQVLISYGIPKERHINDTEILPCIEDFYSFIYGAIRPFRNRKEYETALANGTVLKEAYESETLIEKSKELFRLITDKLRADRDIFQLKQGNNEAFAFAINSGPINISNIIHINTLVNNGSGIHQGFKTSNNEIGGANFYVCPKEMVSLRMQELLYKYNKEWADDIPPIQSIRNSDEKKQREKLICEREAKFHIEFERIHPFEEGNGRTGRIILNKNLIDNELAPILITPEMHDIYIQCIANYDYVTLGNFIFLLSSVTLTEMMSAYRKARGLKPDELDIREIGKLNMLKKKQTESDKKTEITYKCHYK